MKPVSLDNLPRYSPWPARLLGLERVGYTYAGTGTRERSDVLREYEDGYARLLEAYRADPTLTLDALRRVELREPDREVVASVGDALYALPVVKALERSEATLASRLLGEVSRREVKSVVDLGCGYGRLLSTLRATLGSSVRLRGGELSPSAVKLAQELLPARTVWDFDFLSERWCAPLETAVPPFLVTTSYAFHQLPSARPAVELLARYRDHVSAVVCLEPEEDLFGDGLLGLLRRRYGQVRGYSADALRVLRSRDDVEVESVAPNVFGANALLPGTLVVWMFR